MAPARPRSNGSARNWPEFPPTRIRSAAIIRNFCSSAQIRRPSADRSRARSRDCERVSLPLRRAQGEPVAALTLSRATMPNAQARPGSPETSSRLCRAADSKPMSRSTRRRSHPISSSKCSTTHRAAERGGRQRARGLLCCLRRQDVRRQLLPGLLFRRRQPSRHPRGRLPLAMSEHRRRALLLPLWRHDQRSHVGRRRALRQSAKRAELPENLRCELLLPTQGRKLGSGACWRRDQ